MRHLDDEGATRDVVGRLVGHDGEVLRVTRRDGSTVDVAVDRVLASRVLPPHPRLPPEPGGPIG